MTNHVPHEPSNGDFIAYLDSLQKETVSRMPDATRDVADTSMPAPAGTARRAYSPLKAALTRQKRRQAKAEAAKPAADDKRPVAEVFARSNPSSGTPARTKKRASRGGPLFGLMLMVIGFMTFCFNIDAGGLFEAAAGAFVFWIGFKFLTAD